MKFVNQISSFFYRITFYNNPFERYADDAIVHCQSEEEARTIKQAISERMELCKLELHPKKTKIVYCKDDNRKEDAEITSFDFLGYTFRMRTVRSKYGKLFNGFTPAISSKAASRIRNEIRSWEVQRRSDLSIFDISSRYNAILRGWIGYYCKFNKTVFYPILKQFNQILVNWANRKYKKLEGVRLVSLDFRRITMTPNRIPTRYPPSIPKCTKPPHAINTPDLTLSKIAQQKLGPSLSF